MKKKIVVTIGILTVVSLLSMPIYKNETVTNHNLSQSDKNILFEISASYDSIYDNANTEELEERSDFIIIGNVKQIDDVINYSPEINEYIMTSTIGTITVRNVIKSNGFISENDEIPFIRVGGTIRVSEYEKSLTPRQVIRQGLDQMTQQEKENSYIKFSYEDDIDIENGKSYLIYLKYEQKLDRYRIIGMEYGLKEYNESTKQTMNNHSRSWESIKYNIQ